MFKVQPKGLRLVSGLEFRVNWVPAISFILSYHNKETRLFTIGPYYYGNLNQIPEQEPS